jgi:hypothetical protein
MTSILADHQYTLEDFNKISHGLNIEDNILSSEVIQSINRLATLVGAPSYQRTPIFKNKNNNNNNNNHRRERRRQKVVITADDWKEMRNFKTTTTIGTKSNDGIEKQLDDLRTLFNKMTSKNYDDKQEQIKTLLREIIDTNPPESDLMKIGKSIFDIGSMNKFWSELYAKSYRGLIDVFPLMNSICQKNVDCFLDLFNTIRHVEAEEDYDEFCAVNKENNKRRALSSFFVNLMKQTVISTDKVINLIDILMNKFHDYINKENKKNEVDEIVENLVVMISEGFKFIEVNNEEKAIEIKHFVSGAASMKSSTYPSLSSKTVFKFMDLDEEY